MTRSNRYLPAVLLLTFLPGCSGEPTRVYVPGDGYRESIDVTTEQGPDAIVDVDEPVVLQVTRNSGPWVEVDAATLKGDACQLAIPPEPTEIEVADNVTWAADPPQGATFGLGQRDDHTRTVSFDRPGSFTLTATSASWCFEPFEGQAVTVEVGGPNEILDHVEEAWTSDLDGITERGFLRVLTVHNPLYFTFDGKKRHGLGG